MNLKQIRSDYDNGTLICRATMGELIAECERCHVRLEIDPRHNYDGIDCRDKTIEMLSSAKEESEAEILKLHRRLTESEYMHGLAVKAALAPPQQFVDAAIAALAAEQPVTNSNSPEFGGIETQPATVAPDERAAFAKAWGAHYQYSPTFRFLDDAGNFCTPEDDPIYFGWVGWQARAALAVPQAAGCSGDATCCPNNEGYGCDCAPAQPVAAQPDAILMPNWAGEFTSYQHWVNKAQSWLKSPSHRPALCVDTRGRRCAIGADMMRARDEDAFPVRYFWDCELTASTPPVAAPAPQQAAAVPEGWISVTDHMPESGKEVVVIGPAYGDYSKGVYVSRACYQCLPNSHFCNEDGEEMHTPSHWIALPVSAASSPTGSAA